MRLELILPSSSIWADCEYGVDYVVGRMNLFKSATGPRLFFLAALFTWELGTMTK